MKYKVIGWTDADVYPQHKYLTSSVKRAIIDDIREHGYRFGGDAHEWYMPVLNDGTKVSYSWRGWGAVMAEAWNIKGKDGYAYMSFYMDMLIDEDMRVYPPLGVDENLIVPKESMIETFVMHLADEPFFAVKEGRKTVEIRLFDEKRQKIDFGDYIEFRRLGHDDERVKTKVTDIYCAGNFEELFVEPEYRDGKTVNRLRYPPESLGSPENSTVKNLVEGMHRYYTKEQEKKYGVMAIKIEKI